MKNSDVLIITLVVVIFFGGWILHKRWSAVEHEAEILDLKVQLIEAKKEGAFCREKKEFCAKHAPFTEVTYWCEEP